MLELMQQALARLYQGAEDPELEAVEDEQLVQHLKAFMLRAENFVAGNLRQHVAAWEFMFATSGHSFNSRKCWARSAAGLCQSLQHGPTETPNIRSSSAFG